MNSLKGSEDLPPLVREVIRGKISEMEYLLQKDPSMLESQGVEALYQACLHNQTDIIRRLLFGTELEKLLSKDTKMNIIMDTVKKGHSSVLKILLQGGFQANMKDTSVLFHACVFGHIEVVEQLVSVANVNHPVMHQVTPLMTAALYKHTKIVIQLLSYDAEIDAQCSDGTTALMCAVLSKDVATVKLLLKYQPNTSLETNVGTTALMLAAKINHPSIIKALVKSSSMEINKEDVRGRSALMMVCEKLEAKEEVMNLLIKNGADCNKEVDGRKVILCAAFHGFLSTIKLILQRNADNLNIRGQSNETMLMIAAEQGYINVVKYLISQKADINVVSSYLGTALHYAAATNREDIVRYIIKQKPSIYRNQSGRTPSLVAKHNKHSSVQKILESYEDTVDERPYPGQIGADIDALGRSPPLVDTSPFVPEFLNLLRKYMHAKPLISLLYNNELFSEKDFEDLRSWGPVRQAEYVTDVVIGPRLRRRGTGIAVIFRQALLDSRNHVNRNLAKVFNLRHDVDCMENEAWEVFLRKEEQDHIKKQFLQHFIENAKVEDVIRNLRRQCALDDVQVEALKAQNSCTDKALTLIHDVLLRGTVQTLGHFREALQATAKGKADAHIALLQLLPPARSSAGGVTSLEQFFERDSSVRISQHVVYFQNRINNGKEEIKKPPPLARDRSLRKNEISIPGRRASVRDRVYQYERKKSTETEGDFVFV